MIGSEDGAAHDQSATPAVHPDHHRRKPVEFTVEVDGELFAVRRSIHKGWDYDWVSGPNKNYGFSSGGPANPSMDEHREHIQTFLNMVDPATGYIEDE